MKITTQRSIIWLANFALVGGLLVFVWLMSQNSPSRRSQRMKSVIDDLDTRLRAEHGPPPRTGTQAGGAMVKTIFDPNFHYAGYVPPPEPVPVAVTPAGVEKAPPLDTLISVSLISAPGSSVITSDSPVGSDDVIGALVVVKSKPQDKNVRWYRVGDVIGITKDPTNKIDDEDPTMKKWNGAQILEIRDDRIVCQWSDQTVDVVIGQSPSLTGMTIKMSDGSVVGSLGGSGGPTNANRAGPTSSGAFFDPPEVRGNLTSIKLTDSGLQHLEENGERLFESVRFDTVEGKDGKPALKISGIPGEFRDSGLQDGDVVIRIDSTPAVNKEKVVSYIRQKHQRGQNNFVVAVLRDGQERTLRITAPRNLNRVQAPNVRFGTGNADR